MLFEALTGEAVTDRWEVYSVGGGALWDELGTFDGGDLYPKTTMAEIMKWCLDEGCTFVDYVEQHEGPEIFDYLAEVWEQMQRTVEKGLITEGVLPGALKLARKASSYNIKAMQSSGSSQPMGMLFAAALATSKKTLRVGWLLLLPPVGLRVLCPLLCIS